MKDIVKSLFTIPHANEDEYNRQ